MSFESSSSDQFRGFIRDKSLLIVDTSPRVLDYMSSLFRSMGALEKNISLASDFLSAKRETERQKPHVVISDYDLDSKCGLGLIHVQRKQYEANTNSTLFILITGNSSQMAIAKAAEEEVDAYVLKPFTGGILRDTILKAAAAKTSPTEFEKKIDQGKALLHEEKLDEAYKTFDDARALHNAPALAYFYLAQVEIARNQPDKAQEKYLQGLRCNRIHYKCMTGLAEVLTERKLHADAYAVIKRLSHYFPPTPQRLTAMLKLAILTHNYEDVERCHRIFLTLEDKTDELIKYICAALVICGKYYIQKNIKSRSLDLFQRAAKIAGSGTRVLREVLMILLDLKLDQEARDFLKMFPVAARNSNDYLTVSYLVEDRFSKGPEMIVKGQELIDRGINDPTIYRILVQRALEGGLKPVAEEYVRVATEKWPEKEKDFQTLLGQ